MNILHSLKKINFFYITMVYLITFLLWWTFLLYKKTEQHYSDSLKHQILQHTYDFGNLEYYLSSNIYENQLKAHKREKIMIITEGIVFFIILIFLVFRVKKSIEHEIQMSKQQQNFILSITHELKSPLSSIKLMSQTLARHNLKDTQKEKLVNNTLFEVERLQSLVENVLLAAKIDNDSYGFLKNKINLSNLVNSLVEQCGTSNEKDIEVEIEEGIELNADNSGLTSIIINLIENAIKYSADNEKVTVQLSKNNDKVVLKVIDEGIGIEDSERNKIFEKFYRVGNEDTRSSKGTGLGLYIVKELVRFHNGTIPVLENTPKGSIFVLEFKVLQ